ncbi:Crp/Fnr family transcriptional regulator [Denitromonas iodatirespirans]|uniref:Crp/Fnr family transcriptional regulator n=1 Tax=Denitromonas iodatirespirans TaxID=2795389 RepID=A0A944H7J7_DENI1|nr:Crp/Fnr family transcriptional regulator [Denitromonas iodatirespirans]MBT0961254.1 Crp/Fnr family transcriptional regulator [Denitromonas iodatirespirans]
MSQEKIDIPGLLSRMPLFSALSSEDLQQVADATREKRIQKGEMLFQRGDQPKGFYYVIFGQIKLAFSSPNGNEKVVEILGPHQSFGEAVMFMDRQYPVFAESLADTLLLHITRDAVFNLIDQDAGFARRMLAGMAIRLHSMVRDVESYSLRSSTQRVIGYLLQQVSDAPCKGATQAAVDLPTSKQIIASRLNLTPETLSRIFNELSNAGLITVQGKHISLHNVDKLRNYEG